MPSVFEWWLGRPEEIVIPKPERKKYTDLTGQRFTKLLVLNRVESDKHVYKYLCQCDCSNTKVVLAQNLKTGKTKSCGCLRESKECYSKIKLTQALVLERFNNAHGQLYDYSQVVYNGIANKVIIVCNKHGVFMQRPDNHWNGGGCPHCYNENIKNKS